MAAPIDVTPNRAAEPGRLTLRARRRERRWAALAAGLVVAAAALDLVLDSAVVAFVSLLVVVPVLALMYARSRERLEAARLRYALLADAGAVVSSARDWEIGLIELARLCAQRLSDWCFVFILQEDGRIRQLAAAHEDPERQRLAWELLMRYPLDPDRPEGPAKVIRSGRSDLQPRVRPELLEVIAADEENLRLLQALRLRSAMIVPLSARGRTIGAIAFASADSGAVYGPDDLALAEELAARAAVAVDSARLFAGLERAQEELRSSRDQLRAILDGVADAVTAQDRTGRVVYANDAAARSLGYATAEELFRARPVEMGARYSMFGEDGRPLAPEDLPGRRALRGEDPAPTLVQFRLAGSDETRWSIVKATAIRDDDGAPVLAINVIEDVTEQRERERRQRLLADSSRALAASLDHEETLPEVARLAIVDLADWCRIEVIDADGTARTVATAQAHEATVQPAASSAPVTIDAPMVVRGKTVGTLALGRASQRPFTWSDRLLAEELAARCALALDNARLYRERSKIARTLQESLLPPLLPDMPGLDVAARFRAAGEGIAVGGDFYDIFELGPGGWAVAIGDVCGKGSEAAAITALARYTLRAAAMREGTPSRILAMLNEALLRQRSDKRFCTVLFGRLVRNGNGAQLEFASGGHPLPLLLRADGDGGEVGAPGTLLGIVRDARLADEQVTLGPGDAIVLYTDGVTDAAAPQTMRTGADLVRSVGPAGGLGADAIAERLMAATLEGATEEPRDDIAIVVVKVPDDGDRGPETGSEPLRKR